MLGSTEEPLFCAADVAAYIGDVVNYNRKIAKYTIGEYSKIIKSTTGQGQQRPMQYLTEAGLYKYLLQSKGDKAEAFQRFVFKLLKAERARYITAALVAKEERVAALEKINHDLLMGNADLRSALESRSATREPISSQIEKPLDVGCIYFIGEAKNDSAPTKIGYSRDLPRRLQNLQVSNAAELVIRRAILVTHPIEAEVRAHSHFEDQHCRGEWYNLTPDAIHNYSDADIYQPCILLDSMVDELDELLLSEGYN